MTPIAELVRFTLAFVLLAAVVGKARRPRVFVAAVRKLEVLPRRLARPVAMGLVVAEAVVAGALLARVAVAPALFAAGLLFAGFAAVAWFALLRRREADCGCLGGALSLRFNGLMAWANVAVSLAAFVAGASWNDEAALSGADVSVVASAGLLAAVCYWVLSYAESVRKLGEETSRLIQAR